MLLYSKKTPKKPPNHFFPKAVFLNKITNIHCIFYTWHYLWIDNVIALTLYHWIQSFLQESLFLLKFLQNWDNHVKLGPFSWLFIAADLDKAGHMGRDTRGQWEPQTLHCNLELKYWEYWKLPSVVAKNTLKFAWSIFYQPNIWKQYIF